MKKSTSKTLTYVALQRGELDKTTGGSLRELLEQASRCQICGERLDPKTRRCPYCDDGRFRP